MSASLRAGLGLLVGLLSSCATQDSVSAFGRAPIWGWDVEFVEVGQTSREEVLLHLGQPTVTAESDRLLVYYWVWVHEEFTWVGSVAYEGGAYLVLLDDENRIERCGFLRFPTNHPQRWEPLASAAGEWLREG